MAYVTRGAGRLAASLVQSRLVSMDVRRRRRRICLVSECGYRQVVLRQGMCGKCGCLISAKTRLSDEQCPLGYW